MKSNCLPPASESIFFFPSTVTHISFILQRHSHENLAGITLLTFQELLLQRCEGKGWKKQLKFNVYVTRLCSSLQHLESCLEERDKALYCPPLWTCNGFSLHMIQAHCFHVPQACPSIHGSTAVYLFLRDFCKK